MFGLIACTGCGVLVHTCLVWCLIHDCLLRLVAVVAALLIVLLRFVALFVCGAALARVWCCWLVLDYVGFMLFGCCDLRFLNVCMVVAVPLDVWVVLLCCSFWFAGIVVLLGYGLLVTFLVQPVGGLCSADFGW